MRRLHSHRSREAQADEGFVFLVIVIVLAVVMALIATQLFQAATDNIQNQADTVKQAQALQAAQSGVDLAYRAITIASTVAQAPCSVTGSTGGYPGTSTYSVTITYYSTASWTTKITCTSGKVGATTPQSVTLVSTGTVGPETVQMSSAAKMSLATTGGGLTANAFIYSNFTLTGADGMSGTVYVHGNVKCTASGKLTGTLRATGTLTLTGNCKITGTAEGTKKVYTQGSPHVTKWVISQATSITVTSTPNGMKLFKAKGTITFPSWYSPSGNGDTVTPHDNTLPAIPTEHFPTLTWTKTKWHTTKGYTARTVSTCNTTTATHPTSIYTYIKNAATMTLSLALNVTCGKITLKTQTISLPKSLVIFDKTGFTFKANTVWTKTATAKTVYLYVIVPTGGTGNITFASTAQIGYGSAGGRLPAGWTKQLLPNLLFTPNTVTLPGNTHDYTAEIYAGVFNIKNSGSFITVPSPPGVISTTPGGGTTKAHVGIVYERESKG